MALLRKERTVRSLGHVKEPRAGPMGPGNPFGNHCQRAITLALVFEPVLADENRVGVATPLPHQGRAGLQHDAGADRASALLRRCGEGPQSATQREVGAAMRALLQIIGKASDEQIATDPKRRFGAMQLAPGESQLLCRSIEQAGDFGFDIGQARLSYSVVAVAAPTGNGRRLASVLASRRIVGWEHHALADSAMR